MPKVFFRLPDSRNFVKEIISQVNYNDVLDNCVEAFKIQKQKIRLRYDGKFRTENFMLNPKLHHHFVQIQEEITMPLIQENGQDSRVLGNITTFSDTKVKDLVARVIKGLGINRVPNAPQVIHNGVRLGNEDQLLGRTGAISFLITDSSGNTFGYPDQRDRVTIINMMMERVKWMIENMKSDITDPDVMEKFSSLNDITKQVTFLELVRRKYERGRKDILPTPVDPYDQIGGHH